MAIPKSKDDLESQKFVESVTVANKTAVAVVNPDGSNIAGGAGGGGDGAILDGVNALIKASVFDYVSSNPVAVRLTDVGGDYVGAGAGTQYANGAAVVTPTGTASLGFDGANVRVLKTDAAGDVQVDVLSSALPSGAATSALQLADGHNVTVDNAGGGSAVNIQDGGNTITVDAASLPLPAGAATSALQLADGHNVTVDNAGAGAAVNIQDGGNSITVDGTITANLSATDNAVLDQIELNQDTQTGILTTIDADTGGMLTALQIIDDWDSSNSCKVVGNVDHDAADSGEPVKVGGRARTSDLTAVASDDRVDVVCDKVGRQVVMPYCLPENILDGTASAVNTDVTTVIAAQGAGVRIFVTSIIIAHDGDIDVIVSIMDGASVKLVFPAPAYGGSIHTFSVPLMLTANTALRFASSIDSATVHVSAVGYKGV